MPIGSTAKTGTGATGSGRSVTRPPWIKDDPKEVPSWVKRNSLTGDKANGQPAQKEVKLQSREIKVPIMTERKKSVQEPLAPVKPKDKATPTTSAAESKLSAKAVTPTKSKTPEPAAVKPKGKVLAKTPVVESSSSESEYEEVEEEETEEEVTETEESESEESVSDIEPEVKPSPIQVKLRPVEKKPIKLDKSASSDKAGKFVKPVLRKVPKIDEEPKPVPPPAPVIEAKLKPVTKPEEKEPSPKPEPVDFRPKLKKVDSTTKRPGPPPPPPPPNSKFPPPPPPPPGLTAPPEFERKELTDKHKATLEKLRIRPRRRPDWSDMMKEVEQGRKLKHVECNDRSRPILTSKSITNISGQFVYETEKANVHNKLLKQIQFGIKLKSVKTNDRSKPVLEGLRKFRRQMTIEEQIQKSESRAIMIQENLPVEESEDEVDDIDKLRDDLQSTKQMLALELRNKEAQERENKRLLAKIQNLEAELSKSKPSDGGDSAPEPVAAAATGSSAQPANDALVKSLKSEAEEAQKTSKALEKKYQDVASELDVAKAAIEEQKRKIANLEKQLQGAGSATASRRQSEAAPKESSPEPEFSSDDEPENETEEQKAERLTRRLTREVKYLVGKLARLKDKQKACKKERFNLKDTMKKNQQVLKSEMKKFKALQREVDKMAAMMKEDDDDEDAEEKEDEPADEPEEAEEDEDSESEESGSEDDTESESEPEDAPLEKKKINYEPRIKRHEGRLTALKKGNFLHQTNVDRLLDEINKIRENSVTLQHDLDSVLSELG